MLNLKNGINWIPTLFLTVYQTILLVSLPFFFYYHSTSLGIYLTAFVMLYLTGLSITGGYHRYFSHKSFKTNKFIEGIILLFGGMAGQGSALRWSFDHRVHHAHVDTDKDPYCIKKGFWYAHFLWILEKPKPIDSKLVPDLLSNKLVMLQHNYYGTFFFTSNILSGLIFGYLFNDYTAAFVLAVGLRMFLMQHFTWFINSLAHTWGDKPFSIEHSAVNNYIIALLTFGEGYHNYHHTYANDYRNGIYWYQFDPTKWLIWTLSKLKLAHALRQVDAITIKKRMIIEHKSVLMDRLSECLAHKRAEYEPVINELSEMIIKKISEMYDLKKRYNEIKKECIEAQVLREIKHEIRYLKRSLKEDFKIWWSVSNTLMASA